MRDYIARYLPGPTDKGLRDKVRWIIRCCNLRKATSEEISSEIDALCRRIALTPWGQSAIDKIKAEAIRRLM